MYLWVSAAHACSNRYKIDVAKRQKNSSAQVTMNESRPVETGGEANEKNKIYDYRAALARSLVIIITHYKMTPSIMQSKLNTFELDLAFQWLINVTRLQIARSRFTLVGIWLCGYNKRFIAFLSVYCGQCFSCIGCCLFGRKGIVILVNICFPQTNTVIKVFSSLHTDFCIYIVVFFIEKDEQKFKNAEKECTRTQADLLLSQLE